jgi:hypothetical protein
MQPVTDAFHHGWPDAETVNIVDDALSRDLARTGVLDDAMPVLTSPASAVAKLNLALRACTV